MTSVLHSTWNLFWSQVLAFCANIWIITEHLNYLTRYGMVIHRIMDSNFSNYKRLIVCTTLKPKYEYFLFSISVTYIWFNITKKYTSNKWFCKLWPHKNYEYKYRKLWNSGNGTFGVVVVFVLIAIYKLMLVEQLLSIKEKYHYTNWKLIQ